MAETSIYVLPSDLEQLAHFTLPAVQTWGNSSRDRLYKEMVREAANLLLNAGENYAWFAFTIRCLVAHSRGQVARQIPDVENIPKLIVDAFIGVLYPDDNIHYVRGVQVEAAFSEDVQEQAEVWIFGKLKEG